jgi:hypothetical protein
MKLCGIWGGVALIGDGVAGLIWPSRYLRFLKVGPPAVRKTLEVFAERPTLTRAACIAEVGIGVWMIAKNL